MHLSGTRTSRQVALLGLLILVCVISLSSCGFFNRDASFKDENELMREGVEAFNNRNYKKAIERLQTIKDQYPFSSYVLLAELKIADAHYNRKEYGEAIFAYEDFMKLHPRNEATPYALFQVGMCYFKQMRSIDRDQDITRKAVTEFQRLIKTYPDSPFKVRAENRLSICLQNLAKHEIYVGIFYYKMGDYRAAKGRFEGVIKNFPDLGQYNEAFTFIKKCNVQIAKIEKKEAKARDKEKKKSEERKLKEKEKEATKT